MKNFYYSIPTKIAFGEGEIIKLPEYIHKFGISVLLVYGGGSIKKTGLYDKIIKMLDEEGILHCELFGVEPNPRIATVKKGVDICRAGNVDVIVPVGGGSTIDCAKAIAAAFYYEGDVWDLVKDNSLIGKSLPIIAVPTISATGSEMDPFAVITNIETKEKKELYSQELYPAYSILDPTLTYSVSAYQTASGTADIMAHIFEVYFNKTKDTYVQDRIMEGLLKTCVTFGPIAVNEPDNYEARANLMWTSQWAINGMIACGKPGPWPAHSIEHQLSAWYDITHGHGLAIIIPELMRYLLKENSIERLVSYGINVFDIDKKLPKMEIAEIAIIKTKEVFEKMGLTMKLSIAGVPDKSAFKQMAMAAAMEGLDECLVPLSANDVENIYDICY